MKMENKQKPEMALRMGGVSASVWRKEYEARHGGRFSRVNVKLENVYKDKEGRWRSTNYYSVEQLARLEQVVGQVLDRLGPAAQRARARGEAA